MSDEQTLYLLGKIAESLESILRRADGVRSTDDLLRSRERTPSAYHHPRDGKSDKSPQ